jgi:hypothetical protein
MGGLGGRRETDYVSSSLQGLAVAFALFEVEGLSPSLPKAVLFVFGSGHGGQGDFIQKRG